MKIIKVIADRRPSECMLCPLIKGQMNQLDCGEIILKDENGGCRGRIRIPDERCHIYIEEK